MKIFIEGGEENKFKQFINITNFNINMVRTIISVFLF